MRARNLTLLFFTVAVILLIAKPGTAQSTQTGNPPSASTVSAGTALKLPAAEMQAPSLDQESAASPAVRPGQHGTAPPSQASDAARADLWKEYYTAVEYVGVWRNEDVKPLKPLVVNADGTVEVVTATKYEVTSPLYGDTWVTIVPELQTACRKFTGDIVMQVRELLGLPPDHQIPNIFVMKVKPSDIFRPTPDPTPWTLCPCGNPAIPGACKFDSTVQCGNSFPPDVSASHQQWIANTTMSLRQMPGGFPWTHLGYTYNWARVSDHYGASEYIVRKGAQVKIESKFSTEQYCRAQ